MSIQVIAMMKIIVPIVLHVAVGSTAAVLDDGHLADLAGSAGFRNLRSTGYLHERSKGCRRIMFAVLMLFSDHDVMRFIAFNRST